jgi:hypothetical protein
VTALIASDLDRTLIYSRRFFDEFTDATCVEIYDGAPISFMTVDAVARLEALARDRIVLPATTRTVAQFERIQLPGGPYQYAVTSNGGTILCDGAPDARWSATVAERIRAESTPIAEVVSALRTRASDEWVSNFRIAEGLFCYLVVEESRLPADFLEEWRRWCEPRGWLVSRQGRKIYSVPAGLCKSTAVAEVRRRLVERGELDELAPLLAAGDGSLDAGLLVYADAAIRPAHGELHTTNWSAFGLTVTKASGATAGEEILDWFWSRGHDELPRTTYALQ